MRTSPLKVRPHLSAALMSVLLVFLLAACSPGGSNPPPSKRPVVVPSTTKVADPATRSALAEYDPTTGVMRFSELTPRLAELHADDVLVSEPSPAAPNGYLRKVRAVRRDGAAVILETTQANLTDAVHRGELDASGELGPNDLVESRALVEGLSVRPAANVGDGFRFEIGFDETVLDIGEGDVNVKVRVSGKLYFNAGYNVGIGIDTCLDLPPVCVDRFEAWVGFEQRAQLQVNGEANAKLTKEVRVAELYFSPICFLLGPVPVCVVPAVYVYVGASGEVNLRFSYGALQTAEAKIGARWTDDDGWGEFKPTPSFDATFEQNFSVTAGLKASAYIKSEAALMLYGVAGPVIGAKLGLELDAATPRDPFWILRGSLDAYYSFIVDLPVIGRVAESKGSFYTLSKEFGRSANSPPIITIKRPHNRIDLGQPIELGFFLNDGGCAGIYCVSDPEDGLPSYTLVSDRDGALPKGRYTFPTSGLRTITVTAVDRKGARSSATFQVDVINTPPVAYGSAGSDTVPMTVAYYISAAASDPNSKLDCSALTWSATAPDVIEPVVIGTDVCYGRAVFNVQGQREVTLIATDPEGAVSPRRSFPVYVTAPPPNRPPEFRQLLTVVGRYQLGGGSEAYGAVPYGGYVPTGNNPITLTVDAYDPERPADPNAITYSFSARCTNCAHNGDVALGGGTSGTLTLSSPLGWYPGDLSNEFTSADLDVFYRVAVSDGTTSVALIWNVKAEYNSLK